MKEIPLDFDTNKKTQVDLLHAAVNSQFVQYKGVVCKIVVSPALTEETVEQIKDETLKINMKSPEQKSGLSMTRNVSFFSGTTKTYHLESVQE